jgi:hypothetical protein
MSRIAFSQIHEILYQPNSLNYEWQSLRGKICAAKFSTWHLSSLAFSAKIVLKILANRKFKIVCNTCSGLESEAPALVAKNITRRTEIRFRDCCKCHGKSDIMDYLQQSKIEIYTILSQSLISLYKCGKNIIFNKQD